MTPVLLPGNMCDRRLWPVSIISRLPHPVFADLGLDDSVAAMAERVLLETEGPLLPIGFSMGGIVALAIAAAAPERLCGLVLLDTNAAADLPQRAAQRPRQQAAVRAGELERIVVEELKPNYLAAINRNDRCLRALLLDMATALGPEVFVRQSEALRTRADLRHVLETFEGPMLVACGAEDRLCPPNWHRTWATMAKNATLRIVDGAGHMLPLERPKALADALGDWIHDKDLMR